MADEREHYVVHVTVHHVIPAQPAKTSSSGRYETHRHAGAGPARPRAGC